jgi:hypothetical protein
MSAQRFRRPAKEAARCGNSLPVFRAKRSGLKFRLAIPTSYGEGSALMRKLSIVAAIAVLALEPTVWSGCGAALAQTSRATPAGPAGRAGPASRAIPASPSNPPLPASPPEPAYSPIPPLAPFQWPSASTAQGRAFNWSPNGPGRWSPSLVPGDECSGSHDRECNPTSDRHHRSEPRR